MNFDVSKLPRHTIFCIDAKSYYASVECVLRGLPPLEAYLAVVGDLSRRGSVVLAASPRMKKEYGIKTGSRHYEIPRDPKIHIVEARMDKYLKFSMRIPKILNRFGPLENIFVYSVDESFMVYDAISLFGDRWTAARAIQAAIKVELGLPTAVGVGNNYFQAKIALDVLAKSSEETGFIAEVTYENFAEKMWGTPIKDVWGIGSRMERNLNRMGIYKLGDLAKASVSTLKKRFGVMGIQLYNHAWGVDLTNPYHKPDIKRQAMVQKGFSSGQTLLKDYHKVEDILTIILEKAEEVAWRAREVKMAGQTLSLSIGYSHDLGGGGFSCSRTMHAPTNITMRIFEVLKELFHENYKGGRAVRHVHVGLNQLHDDETYQLDLFEDNTKQRELGYVMDKIRSKYGAAAIIRARSLTEGGTVVARSGFIGGHKA